MTDPLRLDRTARAVRTGGVSSGPIHDAAWRALEQALAMHKATPLSRHLEIETYTWDVLPDHLKTGDIVEYVCRELEWVKSQLL